jgi:hypothetical protein
MKFFFKFTAEDSFFELLTSFYIKKHMDCRILIKIIYNALENKSYRKKNLR